MRNEQIDKATDVVGRRSTGRGRHVAWWQLRLTHGHRFSAARLAPWQGTASPGVEFSPDSVRASSIPPYMLACFQIWNIGHISVSVLAARHDSSSAPAAKSRRKEWQFAWRCCCHCQPTATASPACAPPTLLVDPGCVPCNCSIVGAGRGQELLFKCSKEMASSLAEVGLH
ncbi:uncharacterized protein [Miscanthus floridulus]|uniref:uncharacterized protein n=1 Tax=Miscanthus floridulus TaxID=154761 RepID=UPI0034591F6C